MAYTIDIYSCDSKRKFVEATTDNLGYALKRLYSHTPYNSEKIKARLKQAQTIDQLLNGDLDEALDLDFDTIDSQTKSEVIDIGYLGINDYTLLRLDYTLNGIVEQPFISHVLRKRVVAVVPNTPNTPPNAPYTPPKGLDLIYNVVFIMQLSHDYNYNGKEANAILEATNASRFVFI